MSEKNVKCDSLESLLKSSQPDSTRSKSSSWDWNKNRATCCNANLLKTGFLSDLTLCIGKEREEVKVHRIFLQIASPKFYRVFEGHPKLDKMEIEDVDCSTFKMFLEFLYSCSGLNLIKKENALSLLTIATKFEVEELVQVCAKILTGNLAEENALKLFQTGMEYGNKELVNSALSCIAKEARKIIDKDDFLTLSMDSVFEIAQRDDLRIESEIQLFNAIVRWGEAECEREGVDPNMSVDSCETNLKKVIKKLIPLIRFPLMDEEEFITTVLTKEILSSEEALNIMCIFRLPFEKRANLRGTKGTAKFNAKPRDYCKPKVYSVNRFTEVGQVNAWVAITQKKENLSVKVNRNVTIIGIKFQKKTFSVWVQQLSKYLSCDEIRWELFEGLITIQQDSSEQNNTLLQLELKPFDPRKILEILFETGVPLQPQVQYNIQVHFSGILAHNKDPYGEGQYCLCLPRDCAREACVKADDDTGALRDVMFSFSRPNGEILPIGAGIISSLLFTCPGLQGA